MACALTHSHPHLPSHKHQNDDEECPSFTPLGPQEAQESPGKPQKSPERPTRDQKSTRYPQESSGTIPGQLQENPTKDQTRISYCILRYKLHPLKTMKCQREQYTEPPGDLRIPTRTVYRTSREPQNTNAHSIQSLRMRPGQHQEETIRIDKNTITISCCILHYKLHRANTQGKDASA